MKNRQTLDKLTKDDIAYKDTRLQAELMNKCFQSVFTKESKFEGERAWHRDNVMREIQVDMSEIKKIMKDLDVSKAQEPDRVSNWILKECCEQLAGSIHNTIVCSFEERKIL